MFKTVGERIRYIREERGISQEELAKKLGLKDKSSVCKIERAGDNVSTKSVCKYAEALNTTPSFLMGWIEHEGDYSDLDNFEEIENDQMRHIELAEEVVGTAGIALQRVIARMSKQEMQKLYEMSKLMFPHLFDEEDSI